MRPSEKNSSVLKPRYILIRGATAPFLVQPVVGMLLFDNLVMYNVSSTSLTERPATQRQRGVLGGAPCYEAGVQTLLWLRCVFGKVTLLLPLLGSTACGINALCQ